MANLMIPKVALLVIAIITMGVGLYSHFGSDWTSVSSGGVTAKPHKIVCDAFHVASKVVKGLPKCPSISLEKYFVAMVIICFIWAIASLALTFLDKKNKLKLVDAGLQFVLAILLLIGCITHIVSAEQIRKLDKTGGTVASIAGLKVLHGAKIAAAVIGIIQSIVHGAVGFLVFRS